MIPKKSKRNKFLRPFLFNITAYFSKKYTTDERIRIKINRTVFLR